MFEKFKDIFGRIDLAPVNGGVYSTNNQLLYTGECAILMKLINDKNLRFSSANFIVLKDAILTSKIAPGLYSRHPEPYRRSLPKAGRPVSFDEITGASFVFGLTDTKLAKDIIDHGKANYWQYCDVPGFEKGKPLRSMFSKGFFKDLSNYIKDALNYDSDGFRKASQSYTRFYPLFFRHSSSSRVVYRASVGDSCTISESIGASLALLVASLKSDNISTRVLWWFRLKHLEIHKKTPILLKLVKPIYFFSNKKKFGTFKRLFELYYKNPDHPFHSMISELGE
jgi:hypothetical protein